MGDRATEFRGKNIEYCIFDPTGNITALVETRVDPAFQPAIASGIMELNSDVEQVGFVSFADGDVPVRLRMAGGEFCGNATMSAAALYLMKKEDEGGFAPESEDTAPEGQGTKTVRVKVSGAKEPLEVRLARRDAISFDAAVTMPPAVGIDALRLADGMFPGGDSLSLPVVRLEGISHVIIEPDTGFYGLKDDKTLAETLLRGWCGAIGAECLGMMFLDEAVCSSGETDCSAGTGNLIRAMTPLVYVPGADTMFWENSCASGSAAAGVYLAAKTGKPVDVTFDEPAGRLRVESDPETGKTVLHGSVRLMDR